MFHDRRNHDRISRQEHVIIDVIAGDKTEEFDCNSRDLSNSGV